MNMRIFNHTFPAGSPEARPGKVGTVLLTLALAGSSAFALQVTKPVANPGPSTPASAATRPGQTTLTPAAPVSSRNPASSVEDIRDIRQPRHLPTPIPWAAAAAGVIILAGAGFAAWHWLGRRRALPLTPQEIALRSLLEARQLMDPEHAREYCFAASGIIRNYLESQFRLHAPRLTTEEFLRELVEVREQMIASQRLLLSDFLHHCDLAKFAGWRYALPALEAMHNTAVDFVRQTAASSGASLGRSPGTAGEAPLPVAADDTCAATVR